MGNAWIGYLIVAALAGVAGAFGAHVVDGRELAVERAGRADDARLHAEQLQAMSHAALDAEQRAIDEHNKAAAEIAAADKQRTEERIKHENESRDYRAALRSGTERLRIAVASCTAVGGGGVDVPSAAGATGVGDGAAAYADVDPATAERIFSVAGDDENEIDKLKMLQDYVCKVRSETAACGEQ
ncbi:lysis system i-spanin subunit Rz [Burkholderia sp. 22PA0099]|uniref:lysis system i-spanin subunit Rz n=1 Tax=Burkholderia sp. 22PA0099 TaxID=3237372 RepID=UPI0039C4A8FF